MIHNDLSATAGCGEICVECAQACGEAISRCFAQGQWSFDQELIYCLIDCLTICQASASILMRASPNHTITCQAVAEMAQRCAQSCERFQSEALRRCAEECRGCAASCRAMIGDDFEKTL